MKTKKEFTARYEELKAQVADLEANYETLRLKMEEQINKYDSVMNKKKYLEDLGFGLDRADSGYYCLMAGRQYLAGDSADEDIYDEESAWASYYDLIEEMQQDEIASTDEVVNAVYAYNSYASCAESKEEALALWFDLNAKDGLIIEHTPANTDDDEWSSLCGKLDLSRENNVRRILEKKSRGLIVCLSQDFDFGPAE